MLTKIRKNAKNVMGRLIIGLVAIAFIVTGGIAIVSDSNKFDLVTFKHISSITNIDFLRAKHKKTQELQNSLGNNISEEELDLFNLNNFVLQDLITEKIIKYLISYYNLDASEEMLIKAVKESGAFVGENNDFDFTKFRSAATKSGAQEHEYLAMIKEQLFKNMLISSFTELFNVPQIMLEANLDFLAEERKIELVSLDLFSRPNDLSIPTPTDEQLKKFYDNNQAFFMEPERRSLNYLKISNDFFDNKIDVSENDITDYYAQHKESFANNSLAKAKGEISNILKQDKLRKFRHALTQEINDEVASGISLLELSKKYNILVQTVVNKDKQELLEDANFIGNINQEQKFDIIDRLFGMADKEVSDLMELPDNDDLLVVEVNNIVDSTTPELTNIQKQVQEKWQEEQILQHNLNNIEELAKNYKTDDKISKSLKQKGFKIANRNISLVRYDMLSQNFDEKKNAAVFNDFPIEFVGDIFNLPISQNSQVIRVANSAYFVHVNDSIVNKLALKQITKDSEETITANIKNSLLQELISYLIDYNKTTVKNFDKLGGVSKQYY